MTGSTVEEFLVEALDRQGLLDAAADAVMDHQPGELRPIDQHDALAQHPRRLAR